MSSSISPQAIEEEGGNPDEMEVVLDGTPKKALTKRISKGMLNEWEQDLKSAIIS